MEKRKVTYRDSMQLQQVVEYLQALVDELREGEFVIASGGNSLSFKPLDMVEVEVELEHKKGKQELEIELSWKQEDYEEEEGEEDEGEKDEGEKAEAATVETRSTDSGGCEPGPLSKLIPLAGLVGAGVLIAVIAKGKRKKGEVKE
jgi:amphi-Trp domain-containing protein